MSKKQNKGKGGQGELEGAVLSEIHWRKSRSSGKPTPVFLPGESHGQRSLAGHSPWGCKEVDTTNTFTLRSSGRQCFSLAEPRHFSLAGLLLSKEKFFLEVSCCREQGAFFLWGRQLTRSSRA